MSKLTPPTLTTGICPDPRDKLQSICAQADRLLDRVENGEHEGSPHDMAQLFIDIVYRDRVVTEHD